MSRHLSVEYQSEIVVNPGSKRRPSQQFTAIGIERICCELEPDGRTTPFGQPANKKCSDLMTGPSVNPFASAWSIVEKTQAADFMFYGHFHAPREV